MSTSLFEIVGPIMVGPSSSHTAGMARIGMMANAIAGFRPTSILLRLSPTLSTTYRGHRTDAALVGGAIGWSQNDERLRSAIEDAKAAGIDIDIAFYPWNVYHPNTAQLEMTGKDGDRVSVRGVSIGGGSIVIEAIDEVSIQLSPDRFHIVAWGDKAMSVLQTAFPGETVQGNDTLSAVSFAGAPDMAALASIGQTEGVSRVRLVEPVLPYGATISEKLRFTRCEDFVAACRAEKVSFAEMAQRYEEDRSGNSRERLRTLMQEQLEVMKESCRRGVEGKNEMLYGLTSGEDGSRLARVCREGRTISGGIVPLAVSNALGVMEHNASMGCVVAAPTAGSAGIVPGCMVTLQEAYHFTDDQIIDALFVSAMLGVIMAHRDVSFSGSVGGCQGEVGVSSAIAAGGIASLFSDDPQAPMEAMAMCMKNLLGLVCDPVAGPVEVPCIKRNAVGVANAFISADMACAGIESYLPPDQVIDALIDVEHRLPRELRCTTTGGLACTEKAVCLRQRLQKELRSMDEPG